MIFDSEIIEIAKKIADNGGRLYLVGGAVRDLQMNKEAHDMDFCVTGLSAEAFNMLFNVSRVQGKAFPVFVLKKCEFALARKEKKIGEKHTDFEICTDKDITIIDDLSRRDLTINSMAIDVITGQLIDPFGGINDLKNKILRMTTDAYVEDPLRVYRTARFAAMLDFEVEANTLKTMEKMKSELDFLSAERVCTEFRKALLSNNPCLFFEILKVANVLDVHFKEIANLIGVEQLVLYHPEGDAYVHTLEVLDRATKVTNEIESKEKELIRFCALVHDFGKAATPKSNWPHHYQHEQLGVSLVRDLCNRIKLPNVFEKAGVLTSRLHMLAGRYETLRPSTKVRLFMDIEKSRSISYEGMEIVAKCDSKKQVNFANIARKVMQYGVTPQIKEKCTVDGVFDYEKAKQLVMQQRINEIKKLENIL